MEHKVELKPMNGENAEEITEKVSEPEKIESTKLPNKLIEKKLDNPQGPAGRVLRGPLGVH